MLKIWGRISSLNVRKVVLAAQWMGIACERVDAGQEYGAVKTPEYLAKNPNVRVPWISQPASRGVLHVLHIPLS
jgi:glutathione S-transferase